MKETKYGSIICTLMFVILFMFFYTTVGKATPDITEMESEKQSNVEQASSLQEQASGMIESKGSMEALVNEMNSEVADLSGKISEYETQISDKSRELESNKVELESAKQDCDSQYENMKLRIQYMYEQGNTQYIDIILGSSLSESLNKFEYTTKLLEYDRNMLNKYKTTRKVVETKKNVCEQEQQELLALKDGLTEQKKQLDEKIKSYNEQILAFSSSIEEAESRALEYEQKVLLQQQAINDEQQRIEESRIIEAESIARAKREEESRQKAIDESIAESIRIAEGGSPQEETTSPIPQGNTNTDKGQKGNENTNNGSDNSGDTGYQPGATDLDMMAAIMECEAADQSYYGILCVGAVVMNRINSASFPNTLTEVLYQPYQFSPVMSGRFALVLARGANEECYRAAREVLNDGVIVGGWHFFRMNDGTRTGEVIGDHVFY